MLGAMTTAFESGRIPAVTLRHRLWIARDYAGMDQQELAAAIGVSRRTVSNAESGQVTPRAITVNAWAAVCGVPASWLRDGFREEEQEDRPRPRAAPPRNGSPPTVSRKRRRQSPKFQPLGWNAVA